MQVELVQTNAGLSRPMVGRVSESRPHREATMSQESRPLRAWLRKHWQSIFISVSLTLTVLIYIPFAGWSLITNPMQYLEERHSGPGKLGFALTAIAFILSDVLLLRSFAFTSNLLHVLYNYYHPHGKIHWTPLYFNMFYATVNCFYIFKIVRERWVSLNDFERGIYKEHFEGAMSIQDFQKLIRASTFAIVEQSRVLFTKGAPVEFLVLLVSGSAEIVIGAGAKINIPPGLLGEVSFLTGGAATATAVLPPGCAYYSWEITAIKKMLSANPSISRGLDVKIGRQLARKLAQTNMALEQVHAADGTAESFQDCAE